MFISRIFAIWLFVRAKKILLIILGLISGIVSGYSEVSRSYLIEMKDELALAQKKLLQQQAYVESLEEKIARSEISLIEKEISYIDQDETAQKMFSHGEWLSFFFQQRETLTHIIKNQPTCSAEAQKILDQILILITQFSDAVADADL